MINLLDGTTNKPSKFRTRDWVEINDESKGIYDNSNITFKAFILVKGTITVSNAAAADAAVNNTNKKVIFKNYTPFTDCITEINDTQIDDGQKIDVVMPMYNLIEYSDAYSKTSGSLQQYYRDEPALHNKGNNIDFPADNNNSASFKFKQKITGQAKNSGTKDAEIMVPLKYRNNFWMP